MSDSMAIAELSARVDDLDSQLSDFNWQVQEVHNQIKDDPFHDDGAGTPMDVVFQNGRYREAANWTHDAEDPDPEGEPAEPDPGVAGGPVETYEVTDFLFVPFDDTTTPYYITETIFLVDGNSEEAVDISSSSSDTRKVGSYFQISKTFGNQYVRLT